MKKIIESELISIAHRILKLKDKADIDALYNESKNVFEKISVLKFYEDNKFRIERTITDEVIEAALFKTDEEVGTEVINPTETIYSREAKNRLSDNHMNRELINELIEDSENSDIISFDEEIDSKINAFTEEKTVQDNPVDEMQQKNDSIGGILNAIKNKNSVLEEIVVKTVDLSIEEALQGNSVPMPVVEIDPIYNLPLEQISFEQKLNENLDNFPENVIPEEEKHVNFENQHLLGKSEDSEIPFHKIPINKTINDAFSHTITVSLNDRIAFEKNLFNGNSEDLNRVLSQLNTMNTFQEAQDFIEDLVKPDFNYWKGKEEYEERFMQLIQKRFI